MLRAGDRVGRDAEFEVLEHLRQGMTANAYRCTDRRDGSAVFLKEYTSPRTTAPWYGPFVQHQRRLTRAISASRADQFCLLPLKTFESQWRIEAAGSRRRTPRTLYQAFEFVTDGQDLEQRLVANPNWMERLVFARVFLAALVELHAAGIVHGDLKPANIQLIADPRIASGFRLKLIDLDFAHLVERSAPWQGHLGHVGTPGYWSPEHVEGTRPTFASDVFTASIILHELLAGVRPYAELDRDARPGWAGAARPSPPVLRGSVGPSGADGRLCSMLVDALASDSSGRPDARQLHQALLGIAVVKVAEPSDRRGEHAEAAKRVPRPAIDHGRKPVVRPRTDRAGRRARVESIALVSKSGRIDMRTSTVVGRRLLMRMGADARFAAESQFILRTSGAGWRLCAIAGTPNPTCVDGLSVREEIRLHGGETVAIGSWSNGVQRLAMRVEVAR